MTVAVDLDHQAEVVFVRFSTVKLLFFPIFILGTLAERHYGQPTLYRVGSFAAPRLESGVST